MTKPNPTEAKLAAFKAIGNQSAVGELLSICRAAVSKWDTVPARHVLKIEKASGVSRHLLRPDIFGSKSDKEAV